MKSYKVEFLPTAQQDLRLSFEWGTTVWGKTQAKKWLREFYAACKKRLQQFPESCPIAPESEDLGRELRQFVIGRYRVIFIVKGDTVTILYVRGAYSGTIFDDVDEENLLSF
jgi:plasmid stabilization system protein ParE